MVKRFDAVVVTPTYRLAPEHPFPTEMANLTKESLKPDLDSLLYSPLMWSTGHKGFPKTYSQVWGMDTARDEALLFDDMLKAEGTSTRLDLYPGLPHIFFHSFKDLPQSNQWEKDTENGFAWLLASE